MAIDWRGFRDSSLAPLVLAREVAHYAAQGVTKAARANLPAAPDDSHTALLWDEEHGALMSRELPNSVKVGLDVAKLELIFYCAGKQERGAPSEQWLDRKLEAAGLKPASGVKLPYDVPKKELKTDTSLAALARWFSAAAEVLEEVRAKYPAMKFSPVYLWPHHFDMGTLVVLEEGGAKSIGIGISPGDHYYAQPYAYISPYPAPKEPKLPKLPPGAHWHRKDFFGAVATAGELLPLADPRAALLAAIDAAFEAGRQWLKS